MSGVDWARHETLALRWRQGGMGRRVGLGRDSSLESWEEGRNTHEEDRTGTDNRNHLNTQHSTSQIVSTHYRGGQGRRTGAAGSLYFMHTIRWRALTSVGKRGQSHISPGDG